MTGIDETELEYLRHKFELDMGDPARNPGIDRGDSIKEKLTSMGLGLNDDATYDLLQPGLTKQKFDDLEFLGLTYYLARQFHNSQNLSWQDYAGITAASKHAAVERLIKLMDAYKPLLEGRTLPTNADPYHRRILEMLVDDHRSGRLQEYCCDLAVDRAEETYKSLEESWPQMCEILREERKDGHQPDLRDAATKIKDIKRLVEAMNEPRLQDFYTRTGTDQAALDGLHREVALTLTREAIKSGEVVPRLVSGHSSDYCYQYSLGELEAAGVDMNDEATYTAVGMDRHTFWENYRQQVASVRTSFNPSAKIYTPPAP